jgi:NitT/TauT family transport system substrate-binding protein
MKIYKVSEECISCRACVEVAENNFAMNSNDIAFLKKQPVSADEIELCDEAMSICPVEAISMIEEETKVNNEPILANSNIKETLDKYPELKDVLIELSPLFKKMQKPVLYNTIAKFANFNDAAKVTKISVCKILHTINKHLKTVKELYDSMPECIKASDMKEELESVDVSWEENVDKYIYNSNTMDELIQEIYKLAPQQNIVLISSEKPSELLKVITGLNYKFNIQVEKDYRISIFNPKKIDVNISWEERKNKFDIIDVRHSKDPFDLIIKTATNIKEDDGFILIQKFEPMPIINMVLEMGFESITEQKQENEFWVYFHKKVKTDKQIKSSSDKIDVVIQSATPVAYPVIVRLLESEKIKSTFNIKTLKVWEETEKHLAWITNGKADISFSALITSAKLRNSDIKIPALFVWDNFVLLSRNNINSFEDIKGEEIYTPLFEEAPPAKITKYLIDASGLNSDDFNFKYGTPFGRPEEIYKDFVSGKADTVILREPEASYAIKILSDRNEHVSELSFNKIWNDVNQGFGSFPNAGLVLKGEFARKYPEQTKIFLRELEDSIKWVNEHKLEISKLSSSVMNQPEDRIELFMNRVNFEYVDNDELVKKVKQYFDVLNKNNVVSTVVDEDFLKIFRLENSKDLQEI